MIDQDAANRDVLVQHIPIGRNGFLLAKLRFVRFLEEEVPIGSPYVMIKFSYTSGQPFCQAFVRLQNRNLHGRLIAVLNDADYNSTKLRAGKSSTLINHGREDSRSQERRGTVGVRSPSFPREGPWSPKTGPFDLVSPERGAPWSPQSPLSPRCTANAQTQTDSLLMVKSEPGEPGQKRQRHF